MNKLVIVLLSVAMGLLIIGCNDASNKHLDDATKDMNDANTDVKAAIVAENDTAKANAIADWKAFENESDSAVVGIERQSTALKLKISKANYKEREKLKKEIAHIDSAVITLKEKLHKSRLAFNKDVKTFDKNIALKNAAFEREFKQNITGLGNAFKNLYINTAK